MTYNVFGGTLSHWPTNQPWVWNSLLSYKTWAIKSWDDSCRHFCLRVYGPWHIMLICASEILLFTLIVVIHVFFQVCDCHPAGELFFYTAFVVLHRWVYAPVWHFHFLSKQWSCEW